MSKKKWTVDIDYTIYASFDDIEAENENEAKEIAIEALIDDASAYIDINPADAYCIIAIPDQDEEE